MKHFYSYQNTYGHQTFLGGDIPWVAPTNKIAWPLDGVLWGHGTNKVHVSTCRRPMDTELGKVLTYCDWIPVIKPHDPLIMRQLRGFHFHKVHGH